MRPFLRFDALQYAADACRIPVCRQEMMEANLGGVSGGARFMSLKRTSAASQAVSHPGHEIRVVLPVASRLKTGRGLTLSSMSLSSLSLDDGACVEACVFFMQQCCFEVWTKVLMATMLNGHVFWIRSESVRRKTALIVESRSIV